MRHGVLKWLVGCVALLLASPALQADDPEDPKIEGKLFSEWAKDLTPQKIGKDTVYGKKVWQAVEALNAHRTELKGMALTRQAIPGLVGLLDQYYKDTPSELVELLSELFPENPDVLTGIVKSQGNRSFTLHARDIQSVLRHFHPKTIEALPALMKIADKANGNELAIVRHLTSSMKAGRDDAPKLAQLIKEHPAVAEEISVVAARSGTVPVEAAPHLVELLKSVETGTGGGMCCVPGLKTRGGESELAAKGLQLLGPDAVAVLPQLVELLKYQVPEGIVRLGDPDPAQQTIQIHGRVLQILEKIGPKAKKSAPDFEALANDIKCPGRLAAHRAFALLAPEAARKKVPCDSKLLVVWEVVDMDYPVGSLQQKPSKDELAKNKILFDLSCPGVVGARFPLPEFEIWFWLNTSPKLKPCQYCLNSASLEIRGLYEVHDDKLLVLLPQWASEEVLKNIKLPTTFPTADKVPTEFTLITLKRVKADVKDKAPAIRK